ncbi:hypothetical protein [Methylibium sp.]|uniref:hypothetical protein n=1 Tax=Methylibium sp. TaxID=2067992 RepID=UPI003BAC610B
MKRTKARDANGVPQRLIDYFKANPDEELTFPDITVKFGISTGYARDLVRSLAPTLGLEVVRIVRRKP